MAKVRIPTTTIDSTYSDGDVLYGYDVNRIIDVFRAAINANKLDLNKLLTGSDYFYIADDLSGLNELATDQTPANDAKGFIFDGNATDEYLEMYKYNTSSSSWTFVSNLSVLSLLNDVESLQANPTIHYESLGSEAKVDDSFIDYD